MTGKISLDSIRQEREATKGRLASVATETRPTVPVRVLATTEEGERLKKLLGQTSLRVDLPKID